MSIDSQDLQVASHSDRSVSTGRVLICSDDVQVWRELSDGVTGCGFEVRVTGSLDSASTMLSDESYDVCLIDAETTLRPKLAPGSATLQFPLNDLQLRLGRENRDTQLILLSQQSNPLLAASSGFGDPNSLSNCSILERPFSKATLNSLLTATLERSRLLSANRRLQSQLGNQMLRDVLGRGPSIADLCAETHLAAVTGRNVLIRGEQGTGTNLVAQAIHDGSPRSTGPFVKLNCRILSATSLERELFALTAQAAVSATGPQSGCFEAAACGTLFLDEVDAITLPLQKRLLKNLQHNGDHRSTLHSPLNSTVHLVAATHADLPQLVQDGRFRGDLYECISQVSIQTRPLRQRPEDIGYLADRFISERVARTGLQPRQLATDALRLLEQQHWPGNVRELQAVIDRALSLDDGRELTAAMIRPWLTATNAQQNPPDVGLTLKQMEQQLIETTFIRCGGNRERTAQSLQIGLRTLSGKLREYGYPPRGGPGSKQHAVCEKAA